jgi:hypothetical protein
VRLLGDGEMRGVVPGWNCAPGTVFGDPQIADCGSP